jgi:lipopolysaccharide export LptBFGC system permease protein LptF
MATIMMTVLKQEGIEATALSFKDIAWLAGTILVFLTIYFIFKDRRDKRHEDKINKMESEKKEQVEKLRIEKETIEQRERDDKKYQQERYDRLLNEERIRNSEAMTKREEEVRTLAGVSNQLTDVSKTVITIQGMMEMNRSDVRQLLVDSVETRGSIDAAWRTIQTHTDQIKTIQENCWEIQKDKSKEK